MLPAYEPKNKRMFLSLSPKWFRCQIQSLVPITLCWTIGFLSTNFGLGATQVHTAWP